MSPRVATLIAMVLVAVAFLSPFPKKESPVPAMPATVTAVPPSPDTIPHYDWYRVEKVIDGDTLVVDIDGVKTTLRLIGLDTPETVDPRKPVQCFGKAASDEAKKILGGQYVRLEYDASQGTLDKYGRTLAYVYVPANSRPEGILFNEYMIAEGYGHEYMYNLPYKYQKEFKSAEVQAREDKKGLWADSACAGLTSGIAPRPAAAPVVIGAAAFSPSKQYDCSRNVYNCASFTSHAEAQYVFVLCGGDSNDVHKLDNDKDGNVCESLP